MDHIWVSNTFYTFLRFFFKTPKTAAFFGPIPFLFQIIQLSIKNDTV